MGTTGETSGAVQVGEGLDGLQRFWPLDDGVLGYGVAAYMSAKLITCRLYNLQSNQLLAMLKAPGEYAVQSGKELIASLTAVLDQLSEQAGIPLSKLTVAVVSGTTAMESKAAGLNPAELQHDLEEGARRVRPRRRIHVCRLQFHRRGPGVLRSLSQRADWRRLLL